ncbi:MAG: helix-turn-helix domain-containing protein [Pirellulales bacterium]
MPGSGPSKPALLLKPRQAAESLAISPRKLWALTASGEIPHVRIGRCVRYDFADLQQWIADHKRRGRS